MQTSPAEAEGRGSVKEACKMEQSTGEIGGSSKGKLYVREKPRLRFPQQVVFKVLGKK